MKFEDKEKRFFTIEDFKTLLDIPKSYKMCNIDTISLILIQKEILNI